MPEIIVGGGVMERLTVPDVRVDEHTIRRTFVDAGAVRAHAMEFYWRLKDYEDTGLTPEEVTSLQKDWSDLCTAVGECGGLDRMKEFAEANKDGRVVILPCKVGDTVYRVFKADGREPVIQATQVKTLGQAADLVGRVGKLNKLVSVFRTREEAEKALEAME